MVVMQRTANLDGTSNRSYSPVTFVRDPRGLTAEELLSMRAQGMTNPAIARAVNSKVQYIETLIGKTPPELVKKAQSAGGKYGSTAKGRKSTEAVKKPIKKGSVQYGTLKGAVVSMRLEGALCSYHVMPDHKAVDVTSQKGAPHFELKGTLPFSCIEPLIDELMNVMTAVDDMSK